MKDNSKILIALGSGAILGALLGILFAPGKGSETRKKISETKYDLAGKVKAMKEKITGNAKTREDGRSVGVENEINEYVS